MRVSGATNFDRQWGFNVALEVTNTNYFTAQLDDGRDIFVGIVRLRENGEEATLYLGSISDAAGHVTTLHRGDFKVTPTGYWQRDPGCAYPVDYDIEVAGMHLHIRPSVQASEVRATPNWPQMLVLWPWAVYWDGETQVSGDASGRGWLDLAKYCPI
jgi:predicted secreted hydrolase